MIQQILAIWFLVSRPFLNPAWTSGSSRFMYYWSLAWRILSIILLTRAAAAAAAKSFQSCPTLWDPIDGSPPGPPIPGILQARTLEWVAISFSILQDPANPHLLSKSWPDQTLKLLLVQCVSHATIGTCSIPLVIWYYNSSVCLPASLIKGCVL